MKRLKVAISQRIIPHYRIRLFTELASRQSFESMVLYGSGFRIGTEVNATKVIGFPNKKLFTIKIPVRLSGTNRLFVLHPSLFVHLVKGHYDMVITEPTTNFFNLFSIYLYCRLLNKKMIWYEAGGKDKALRTFWRNLVDPFIRLCIRQSNALIAYNSYARQYLVENYGVSLNKIFLALNSLDTNEIQRDIMRFQSDLYNNEFLKKLTGNKVILYSGSLDKRKRVNNLISAGHILRKEYGLPLVCLIMGDGPDLNWIKDNCTNEELTQTYFLGRIIDEAVRYILISDLVVLPGQGGLAINHALACGKPVVATQEAVSPNTLSIYDYITDGFNGYVANINDKNDLSIKILTCLQSKSHYDELCKGAILKSMELSVENMADSIENAIHFAYENPTD